MTPSHARRLAPSLGFTSHYTTERRLLRRYDELFRAASQTNEALDCLILACLGTLTRSKREAADDRLQHAMPELIKKLRPEQQAIIANLLLRDDADFPAAVRELVRMENGIWRRDEDPRLRSNDDWRLKVAGLGRLSKEEYTAHTLPTNP